MKNFVVAAVAVMVLAGTTVASQARYEDRTGHNRRPHSQHARICKDIYKTKVVWKHHKKHLVKVKVGRKCY